MWMMTCSLRASRGFCNGEPDGDWDEARVRNDDEGSSRMRDLYWSEEKRVTRSQNGALNGRASISPQNGGRTKSSTVKRRKKEANVVTADQSLSHSNEKLDKIEELRSKDEGEKVEKLRLTSEWEEPKSDVDDYHSYSSV
nr:putative PHD zinc finger protein [Ipomoea batatas]